MRLSKLCKLFITDPEEKTAINKKETNRKRFLEKFFIVPEGIPLIPKCIAFFVQASTHFPHLLQNIDTLPVFIPSLLSANNGHTSTHL
jgi:hypothetical protein